MQKSYSFANDAMTFIAAERFISFSCLAMAETSDKASPTDKASTDKASTDKASPTDRPSTDWPFVSTDEASSPCLKSFAAKG